MDRLWSGQELCFALCCPSSTPSSLSSSSTVRRWRCHFAQLTPFFSNSFSVPEPASCLHRNSHPQITLFYNCRPATKTFRSTTSTFFFLMVLLFGWGLATAVMVYSLAQWVPLLSVTTAELCFWCCITLLTITVIIFPPRINPSRGCGPFRFFPYMWEIVPDTFNSLSKTTKEFLFFIGSQAFSIPLFLIFGWVEFLKDISSSTFYLWSCGSPLSVLCYAIIAALFFPVWCCVIS